MEAKYHWISSLCKALGLVVKCNEAHWVRATVFIDNGDSIGLLAKLRNQVRVLLFEVRVRVIGQDFKCLLRWLLFSDDMIVLVLKVCGVSKVGLHEVALPQHLPLKPEMAPFNFSEVMRCVYSRNRVKPIASLPVFTRLKRHLRGVPRVSGLAFRPHYRRGFILRLGLSIVVRHH